MSKPLSFNTIEIIKATIPVLQQHGVEITTRMYERLFADPEIKALFDEAAQKTGEQPRRLAEAILIFATHVDNLEVIQSALEKICARHVARHVKAEHYSAVATALLAAIRDVLGDVATDSVLQAWGEAYWFLADILIDREKALYASQPAGV